MGALLRFSLNGATITIRFGIPLLPVESLTQVNLN